MSFRSAAVWMVILAGFFGAGCHSFDTSIRNIISPDAPPGYKPPVYMTGTKEVELVDPSKLSMEVWRLNADRFPDSVRLYVRVSDGEGNLVSNLAPPYYKGTADYHTVWNGITERLGDSGRTYPIKDFTVREFSDRDGIPYEIGLALDYSGSMGSTITAVEGGAKAFINLKRPQDRIALVKFDKEPHIVQPLTDSQSDLLSKFTGKGLEGYGNYSAMFAAAKTAGSQLLESPADHPRALVVFTDGEDNASIITAKDMYAFSHDNNIPIFTIAFGAANAQLLTELSTNTGGKFYQTYSSDELKSAFEDIYRSLRNYYLVSYKPPYLSGKHIVQISMNTPGANPRHISAMGSYNTLIQNGQNPNDTLTDGIDKNAVYFEYNKYEVKPAAMPSLLAIASLMKEQPRLKIEVRGHTDSQGTEAYNQKLSEERAEAVRQVIIAQGIDSTRVNARGFGMNEPKESNDTEEGRQKNRRTEFVILAR